MNPYRRAWLDFVAGQDRIFLELFALALMIALGWWLLVRGRRWERLINVAMGLAFWVAVVVLWVLGGATW